MIKKILQNPLILLTLGFVAIVVLLFINVLQSPIKPQKSTSSPIPTSVQKTSETTNSNFQPSASDLIGPNITGTTTPLSAIEQSFPNAVSQDFSGRSSTQTGTLVVTSQMKEVHVVLDAPDSDIAIDKPVNITPFKLLSMPIGTYQVVAAKKGYDQASYSIQINATKVTRLEIELQPLQETE